MVNPDGDSFQLSHTYLGGAIGLSDSGGNGHVFTWEGIDLTSTGTGLQELRLDTGSVTGKFDGVGGAKAFAVPTVGDGRVTSSTTGVSGGFIEIGSPDAYAAVTVNTTLTINGGADLNARDIVVATDSRLDVKSTSESDGVGFVSVANASATAIGTNNSTLTIHDNATLSALKTLSVTGHTASDVAASASSDKTGFLGFVKVRSKAEAIYTNVVTVNGDLTAGTALTVTADTDATANVRSVADADGFGADGDSNDEGGYGARIGTGGSRVAVVIGGTANLVGDTVAVIADTNGDTYAYGESDSDAVGADSDARADAIARGTNEVVLSSLAQITGNASVTFTATLSKTGRQGGLRLLAARASAATPTPTPTTTPRSPPASPARRTP